MRFRVDTLASVEGAFAAVADYRHLDRWDPPAKRSALESGKALQAGAVYRIDAPFGLVLRYTLVEAEAPHRVEYVGGTQRVKTTDVITIVATDSGCRVDVVSSMRFRGLATVLAPFVWCLVWLGARLVSLPAMRRHLDRLAEPG